MLSLLSFYKTLIANPRTVGAGIPSSWFLANTIAGLVPVEATQRVVELGPGTGVITRALLKRGIMPQQLDVIELSPQLAQHLKKQYPDINVISGNATQLNHLLNASGNTVQTIISSLPLLLFPVETSQLILAQIDQLLPVGGLYIQYTYSKKDPWAKELINFHKVMSKSVRLNIPPARVLVYKKCR